MFERDKQYQHVASNRIVEIICVGKQIVLARTIDPGLTDDDIGDEVAIFSRHSLWKPLKKVVEADFEVIRTIAHGGDDVITTIPAGMPAPAAWSIVGKLRVKWTEGEGVTAEPIE